MGRRVLTLLLSLPLGCADDSTSTVMFRFVAGDVSPRPEYLLINWRGGEGIAVQDLRLPQAGRLPPTGADLGTLAVEIETRQPGDRTIFVRGMRDGTQVGAAAARIRWPEERRREIVLSLSATLPDTDGDGVPDVVDDDCDGMSRRTSCPVQGGDGGAGRDATGIAEVSDRPGAGTTDVPGPMDRPDAGAPERLDADAPLVDGPARDVAVADAATRDGVAPADAADGRVYPCPCSLWPPATIPTFEVANEAPGMMSLELGVRFSSEVGGRITALRFFKVVEDSGVHTASLWTATGTRLATATYANESPSGWQQVNLPVPVGITAGTSYVASYYTTSGRFAHTTAYFQNMGVSSPPLHAPRNETGNGNGLFVRGPSALPTVSSMRNYWADVVFVP